ncbi:hypothetical protein QTP88_010694 [Uroleucon formosanum]
MLGVEHESRCATLSISESTLFRSAVFSALRSAIKHERFLRSFFKSLNCDAWAVDSFSLEVVRSFRKESKVDITSSIVEALATGERTFEVVGRVVVVRVQITRSEEEPLTDLFPEFMTSIDETRNWNNNFGASLLLANSPMSPKVVNGSFAALFDNGDDWSRKLLRSEMKDSSSMRRRIRGILMSGKQFSLDSRMDLVQGMVPTASKKAIMSECTTNPSEETSENKNTESDEKEKNGEPTNSKSRIFRLPQHETNLTPLMEGNNTDLID